MNKRIFFVIQEVKVIDADPNLKISESEYDFESMANTYKKSNDDRVSYITHQVFPKGDKLMIVITYERQIETKKPLPTLPLKKYPIR